MSRVCAVTFTPRGRLYYLDPGEHSPHVGDMVLYPTDAGDEVAQCIWAPERSDEDLSGLPVMAGFASDEDVRRDEQHRAMRAQARVAAKKLIREHALPMKVIGVDYVPQPDADGRGPTVTIYFSAEHRVDFRELVRDLAKTMQMRVELRQLSARDQARILGGIGPCGRETCCSTFLKDFEPVSVRMARDQDLPLNPMKISGACGRLMCCLKYEHPLYQDFAASAPATGEQVETPDGPGVVVGRNVPSDTVVVRVEATGKRTSCAKADVCGSRALYRERGDSA